MTIRRFEDIEAWKAARKLSRLVIEVTGTSRFSRRADLKSQLRRAAASPMANIAEGFDSGSDREFGRFLRIARKSAREVQSHLYSALDQRAIDADQFDKIYGISEDVRRLIGGFLRYLSSSKGQRSSTGDWRPETGD
jgi:four helix bundle protein